VGGADSAAKAALYLSELAKKVYIIYRGENLRCEPISFEKIKERKNIEIYCFAHPKRITGDKKVKQIEVEEKTPHEKTETFKLDVDGIFIEIGAVPAKDIINDLKLEMTEDGYIITDKAMKTSVKGVFAAGDITNNFLKQVVTASAEGAIAAKSAYDFLKYEYKEKS
jgi:thioredoxin reductase (NADPH)